MSAGPLIETQELSRNFPTRKGLLGKAHDVWAVNKVDLGVRRGEAVGVVGESGCGKSTLGRLMLGLLDPSAGSIRFDGQDLSAVTGRARRQIRRRMQMIFQDPYGSLDPRRTIGAQVADGLRVHNIVPAAEVRSEVARLLDHVGLDQASAGRRPHEFSGGQRQRIAVARALATRARASSSPTSRSPRSTCRSRRRSSICWSDLRGELDLAMLFISHDLHVVRHLCSRLIVMYLGRVVEEGPAKEIFEAPAPPVHRGALLEATPSMKSGRMTSKPILQGDLPSPANPPSGCAFRTRCPLASTECAEAVPPLAPFGPTRRVACIKAGTHAI